MELIRRETDYAVRALLHLVGAGERYVSCTELARSCDIPSSLSYKVMGHLRSAGLARSRGGRTGGFRLRRSPARISLREVVKVMQGPIRVSRCQARKGACAFQVTCPLSRKLAELQRSVTDFLAETTLGDLAEAVKETTAG